MSRHVREGIAHDDGLSPTPPGLRRARGGGPGPWPRLGRHADRLQLPGAADDVDAEPERVRGAELRDPARPTPVANEAASAFLTAPIPLAAGHVVPRVLPLRDGAERDGRRRDRLRPAEQRGGRRRARGRGRADGLRRHHPERRDRVRHVQERGGDPNANHVGLLLDGTSTVHTATATPAFTMAGGGVLNAWVDYDGVGKTISVYLAQTSDQAGVALLSHALNLFTQLGAQMYVGFTVGHRGEPGDQRARRPRARRSAPTACPASARATPPAAARRPPAPRPASAPICSATNHAACTGATPVCDVPVNTCVGCLDERDLRGPDPDLRHAHPHLPRLRGQRRLRRRRPRCAPRRGRTPGAA